MAFPKSFLTPLFDEPGLFIDKGRETNDRLNGNNKANTLNGGIGNDQLNGKGGNDALQGGSGEDTLLGGEGNDKLQAASGNDKLLGGNGNDALFGGRGDDTLNGGNDNDLLQGGDGNDTYQLSKGKDVIYDTDGSADHLDFGAIGFETLRFTVLDVVDSDHNTQSDGLVDTLLIRGAGFQLMIVDYFDNTAERAGDNGAGAGLIESFDFEGVSVNFSTIQLLVANLEPDSFVGLI